jgi:hypothetical protein
MARSEALGIAREVILSKGVIRYRERGDGPPWSSCMACS